MGFGVVLWDSEGLFVAAIFGHNMGCFPSRVAEAIRLKEVLSWILSRSCTCVDVEVDNLELANCMSLNIIDQSKYGLLIFEFKKLVNCNLGISFFWIKRQANRVTHLLVRASLSYA